MTPRDLTSSRISISRPPLDAHAGQADKVGAAEPVEVDVFDVLVDQRHVVMVRDESGKQGQTGDRQVGALAEQLHAMLQPPERDVEARIDDDDIGHGTPGGGERS